MTQQTISAEQATVSRVPDGVSLHDMPGGWRACVGRKAGRYLVWYAKHTDDPRLLAYHERSEERRVGKECR